MAERGSVSSYKWDVFVSYASEDSTVAKAIASGLLAEGLRVWFDEFELVVGASIAKRIDEGLRRSKYGVVVLSPSFFKKKWTGIELDNLMDRAGGECLLPVWHGIDRAEVAQRSSILANVRAVSTEAGLEQVVASMIVCINRGTFKPLWLKKTGSAGRRIERGVTTHLKAMDRNRPLPSEVEGDLEVDFGTGHVILKPRAGGVPIVVEVDDISAISFGVSTPSPYQTGSGHWMIKDSNTGVPRAIAQCPGKPEDFFYNPTAGVWSARR